MVLFNLLFACQEGYNEKISREVFSTPEKTYHLWIEASVRGDLAASNRCVTKASKKMIDLQAKNRDEFMRRLVRSSAVFMNFSVVDEKITGDDAVIIIESPDKKGRILVPFLFENGEWKVDVVRMFAG